MSRLASDLPSPHPEADPSLDGLLCFAIYSAGLAFGRVYRPLLEATGLTYVQYMLMVVLWGRDDRTVGDLCETLFLTTSTLTPVLQKLEARGLLRRTRSVDDEREVRIAITDAGRALREGAEALPDCIRTATGLDDAAMRALHAAVSSLRDQLLDHRALDDRMPPPTQTRATPRRSGRMSRSPRSHHLETR